MISEDLTGSDDRCPLGAVLSPPNWSACKDTSTAHLKSLSVGQNFEPSISSFNGQGSSSYIISDVLTGLGDRSPRGAAQFLSHVPDCRDTSAVGLSAKEGGVWTMSPSHVGQMWTWLEKGVIALLMPVVWGLQIIPDHAGYPRRASGGLPSSVLRLMSVLMLVSACNAVCPHCSDTIVGCTHGVEGGYCPLVADVTVNARLRNAEAGRHPSGRKCNDARAVKRLLEGGVRVLGGLGVRTTPWAGSRPGR